MFFFFNDTATTEIYTLSLHDALPIYGEQVYVAMLVGLHYETASWNVVGQLFDRFGWTTSLTEGNVASSGIADSFLKVAHLTRTI